MDKYGETPPVHDQRLAKRFIRLVSPNRRNEFIVYVLERNLDPALTLETIEQDETRAKALLERALDSFTILH